MVSNQKHFRYISDSTTDEDTGDMDYKLNNQQKKIGRRPTRTPKCFSKNALMARENRLKKKVYITNLESDVSSLKNNNNKLSAIVENQSFTIDKLKQEIKYLKSVISNSEGIGKLIRAINLSTGMPVTSSLDKQLVVNTKNGNKSPLATQAVSEVNQWGQKKQDNEICIGDVTKKHPWEEKDNSYINYPTPDSTNSYYTSPELDELNSEGLLLDLDLPFEMNNDELLNIIDEKALESPVVPVDDHNSMNYEQSTGHNNEDDVGVCLHVSNNKVSLEFCPSCSDSALHSRRPT